MARPSRNNVDYFPFICKETKAMYFIEQKYKNDGFAVWVKILREMAITDYHYLNLNDEESRMFLSAKFLVDESTMLNIVDDLVRFKQFNKELWIENKIIFSEKFIDTVRDAYKKRNTECITLEGILEHLSGLGLRKLYKSLPKGSDNPQSKEENKKEDKIIKTGNIIEVFFQDLPNSEALVKITKAINVPKDTLLTKLPEFKKYARLEYKGFTEFAEHFKNWYLKLKPEAEAQRTNRPKKLGS